MVKKQRYKSKDRIIAEKKIAFSWRTQEKEEKLARSIWHSSSSFRELMWKGHLKRRYKLTPKEYESLYESQRKRCAICLVEFDISKAREIYVDHNHKTGKVRALLCKYCNSGIGFFKENISILEAAMVYLKTHEVIKD